MKTLFRYSHQLVTNIANTSFLPSEVIEHNQLMNVIHDGDYTRGHGRLYIARTSTIAIRTIYTYAQCRGLQ